MTRNVYHGVDAEFAQIAAATNFGQLLNTVAATFVGYQKRNFPERAEALADEIEATQPDLIGLQEAVLVRTQFPADGPATPAPTVAFDYVQILLDALAARGLQYAPIAESIGFDAELPSVFGFDVRHTDREVILARTDLKTSDLKLSNVQTGHFVTNCVIPAGTGPIQILRGWASVDTKIRGKTFRFVSTHLDGDCSPFFPAIQVAQVNELLQGPGNTDLPLVFVGDFNSNADGSSTPTYGNLIAAGFADVWNIAGSGSGFTCCQAEDWLNPISSLSSRIDLVLFRGDFTVADVDVVGADPSDRTPSGLWPSDHAGVVATLQFRC